MYGQKVSVRETTIAYKLLIIVCCYNSFVQKKVWHL